MNKGGHLFLTGKYLPAELEKYRGWILLGSIMPDILLHTYKKLHVWNSTADMIFKDMKKLAETGMGGWYSWFRFGYNLHYVEDYFTYPHNADMDLVTHVYYEKKFTEFMKMENDEQCNKEIKSKPQSVDNVKELIDCIKVLHERYSESWSGYEKDEKYMTTAVQCMYECYEKSFNRNKMYYSEAVRKTMNLTAQENYTL